MSSQPKKTDAEIQAMRDGGKLLATIFDGLKKELKPGMTGLDVDMWVAAEIKRLGAVATYKTSEVNFPAAICISVNDAIVHGVPTSDVFERGDVVGFDLVIEHNGMKTDSAFTTVIGEEPKGAVKHLLKATERSLYAGIDAITGDGTRIGDISSAIQTVLSDAKLGVMRELVGHGVGHEMHMPPEVPNWEGYGGNVLLRAGDTIAIEPMACLGGDWRTRGPLEDGWTYATKDGSLAAHFEHTVLVTDTGVEILTSL
jgi:methionyl aminopeptidase